MFFLDSEKMEITPKIFLIFVVVLVIGIFLGILINVFVIQKKISNVKETSKKIMDEAIANAKTIKKEAELEAKEEIFQLKAAYEKEEKDKKIELHHAENRIQQKEELIDKKQEQIDKKIEYLEQEKEKIAIKDQEIEKIRKELISYKENLNISIQKVANMTKQEAKAELVKKIEDEAKKESIKFVRNEEENAREEAIRKSREIIALAVQKCAVDHSSDLAVSVVHLANDDLKGKIIGREGRNIRTLENVTGVDLIIDDTPDAVVLSSFDPFRREVARITLERLLADGRIHPARIEELVQKVKREMDVHIKEIGEQVVFEAGVFGMHPELIKLLGRLKYRSSYGQNVLEHSLEVCHLSKIMAGELGANINVAKRGGLLHDIGKALDHEIEGTHVSIGVDLCKKFNESKEVIHCVAGHHFDIQPTTVEAILVQTADAISGARPGARRESLDNYIKRIEKLEEIASSHKGVEKAYAIQAGRELRIIVKPEIVDDVGIVFLSKEIAREIENKMEYPGQIKVHVVRETRNTEIAK